MLAALLLLSGLALANEDTPVESVPDTVEVEVGSVAIPDNLAPLTVPVYRGTEIRFMDENGVELAEVFKLGFQAYLVPENQFDKLLSSHENLGTCRTALGVCREMSREALTDAQDYYRIAREQFQSDDTLVTDLTTQVTELEFDLDRERVKTQRLRGQRNLAWAITGGLVLGSVTVTTLAIGI